MDYAKRAEEIANTDYIARCDCEMRENVETVADVLRAGDMAHLAELRAAHDAGVAEERARWRGAIRAIAGRAADALVTIRNPDGVEPHGPTAWIGDQWLDDVEPAASVAVNMKAGIVNAIVAAAEEESGS